MTAMIKTPKTAIPRFKFRHHLALSYLNTSVGPSSRVMVLEMSGLLVFWCFSNITSSGFGGSGRKAPTIHATVYQ